MPAHGSALAYFDSYRTARLPQSLTQAQRDAFGAHTYERVDRPGAGAQRLVAGVHDAVPRADSRRRIPPRTSMASLNLASVLEHTARLTPDREAITFGQSHLTFAELDTQAARVAAGLAALGIRPGDHVALSCPNLPFFPIAYYGILKAGAVVVPLNVLLKPREIAYHLARQRRARADRLRGDAGAADRRDGPRRL